MEPLLIVDTAMAPMDIFNRLKKYYSGDAGTPAAVLFIGPEPLLSSAAGLGLQRHPHHPAVKPHLAQNC
jgi:hypothetical protein